MRAGHSDGSAASSKQGAAAFLRLPIIAVGLALIVLGVVLLYAGPSVQVNVVVSGLATGGGVTLGTSEAYLASRRRMHSEVLDQFNLAKQELGIISEQNQRLAGEIAQLTTANQAIRSEQAKGAQLTYRSAYTLGAYSIFIPLATDKDTRDHILRMMLHSAEALGLQEYLGTAFGDTDFLKVTNVLEFGITERYDSLVRGAFRLGVLVGGLKSVVSLKTLTGVTPAEYADDISGLMRFIGVDQKIVDYTRESMINVLAASTEYNDRVRFLYVLDYFLKCYGLDWDYDNVRVTKEFLAAGYPIASSRFRTEADEILRRFDVPLDSLFRVENGLDD